MTALADRLPPEERPAQPFAEEWRAVVGFPGYEVSNRGRIRSRLKPGRAVVRMRGRPRLRKLVPDRDGYLNVGLRRERVTYMRKVHQLVLEAFTGPCPAGLEARHLDGVPANNAAENLAWSTHPENEADKDRHGTHTRGERNGMARLSQDQADRIRARLAAGERGYDLAAEYGVSQATVCRVKKGKRYA